VHPLVQTAAAAPGLGILHCTFFAGLRHLALDVHWAWTCSRGRQSSLTVMLATGLVTLLGRLAPVLMKSATGSHTGTGTWLLQRATALVLALVLPVLDALSS
jgi:hypothetical protein